MPFGLSRLAKSFPSLTVKIKGKSSFEIVGDIHVNAYWGEFAVNEWFSIKIIAENFPEIPPRCIETSGKVKDYHINREEDLCLGSPRSLYEELTEHPNIVFYINKFVIPFFFSFRYNQKYGVSPFGELAHGGDGLFPSYREIFKTNDLAICTLLTYGNKLLYRGHHACPCNSGLKLRKCHGPKLRAFFKNYHPSLLLINLKQCACSLEIKDAKLKEVFKKRYDKAIKILNILVREYNKV